MTYNEYFMRRAIELAAVGGSVEGGGPFGAVITRNGKIIAECHNLVGGSNDATQHAELRCIQLACAALGSKSLAGCVLYTSCEPCTMCLGACGFSELEAIYFGATVADAELAGFSQQPMPFNDSPKKRYAHFNMQRKMRKLALKVWDI
jgi:tRNA(Arg) A34 adenosine deaminase TadA